MIKKLSTVMLTITMTYNSLQFVKKPKQNIAPILTPAISPIQTQAQEAYEKAKPGYEKAKTDFNKAIENVAKAKETYLTTKPETDPTVQAAKKSLEQAEATKTMNDEQIKTAEAECKKAQATLSIDEAAFNKVKASGNSAAEATYYLRSKNYFGQCQSTLYALKERDARIAEGLVNVKNNYNTAVQQVRKRADQASLDYTKATEDYDNAYAAYKAAEKQFKLVEQQVQAAPKATTNK